jgi:hypothetical protein
MRPARPGRAAFFTRVRAVSAALLQHGSTYGLPLRQAVSAAGRCRGAGMGSCPSRLPSPAAVVVARNVRDRLTVVASWTHAPRPGGAARDVVRGPGPTAPGRPLLLPSQPINQALHLVSALGFIAASAHAVRGARSPRGLGRLRAQRVAGVAGARRRGGVARSVQLFYLRDARAATPPAAVPPAYDSTRVRADRTGFPRRQA